ncbi:MAG: hypothetical protein KF784_04545 [Fimbriimonadaceae bacterium]|nr:hypothetical protein [Fimbriimonadaceae bacterium]
MHPRQVAPKALETLQEQSYEQALAESLEMMRYLHAANWDCIRRSNPQASPEELKQMYFKAFVTNQRHPVR